MKLSETHASVRRFNALNMSANDSSHRDNYLRFTDLLMAAGPDDRKRSAATAFVWEVEADDAEFQSVDDAFSDLDERVLQPKFFAVR